MKTKLLLMLLMLAIAGNALADVDWNNSSGDRRWDNPDNWWDNVTLTAHVPNGEKTGVRNDGIGPIIDSSTAAVTGSLPLGDQGRTGVIDITGGSLTANDWFILGYGGGDEGTFNVSGGVTVIGNGKDLTVGREGIGRLNMSDGSITVEDKMYLGSGASGTGYMDMTGGLITIDDDLYTGDDGTAHMTISDGVIDIFDRIYLGNGSNGEADLTMTGGSITLGGLMAVGRDGSLGELFLYGGVLDIGQHLEMGPNGTIDITEGTLIIEGDRISEGVERSIMPFINDGRIVGYGGLGGRPVVDYDITNPGKTTVTAMVVASIVSPENEGTFGSPADVDLIWTNIEPNALSGPVYVDVWFGTEPNKLEPAVYAKKITLGENVEIWTEYGLTAGTYYWQVDSYLNGLDHINDANLIEGLVWSFNLADDTAPSMVIDTPDMVTWSGQGVPLNATVVDDGMSAVTYAWTSDPNAGVVFSESNVEDPIVTITSPTVSTVTVTLAVSDEGNPIPVTASIEIDVYETACNAARIGFSLAAENLYDFNEDCITNLEDLAELAKAWLVDYAITGPTARPVTE